MGDPLSITLRLLLIVALVLANGLFVAAEFSIVTARRARMESLAAQGNPFARLVSRAIDNVNNYLAATQLGITMASIGLGWVDLSVCGRGDPPCPDRLLHCRHRAAPALRVSPQTHGRGRFTLFLIDHR